MFEIIAIIHGEHSFTRTCNILFIRPYFFFFILEWNDKKLGTKCVTNWVLFTRNLLICLRLTIFSVYKSRASHCYVMEYQLLIDMDRLKNDILVEVLFFISFEEQQLFIILVRVTAFYKFLTTIRWWNTILLSLYIPIEIRKFYKQIHLIIHYWLTRI